MTWFDLGALAIVVLAIVDGVRSGAAWALTELALLACAALLAGFVRPFAEPYLQKIVVLAPADLPWAAHATCFGLLACMFMGVAFLLQPMAKKWRFTHDQWPGAVIGVVTGALAALVLFSLAVWGSPRPYEAELTPSYTGAALVKVHRAGLRGLFPEHVAHRLDDLRAP